MTRLLLVRHGQSAWNASGRWQGWADVPLSDEGESQAAGAADRLRDRRFGVVATSDLERARRTAEIVAAALGIGDVTVDRRLREYDVGQWSGLTRSEIEQGWPGDLEAWREGRLAAAPGGETRKGFVARILAAVEALAGQAGPGNVLVVTHGGVVGAVQRALHAPDAPRIGNLDGRWLESTPAGLRPGPFERLLDRAVADGPRPTLSPSP